MKLPAAAIATACLVHLVLISRASNEACEEDSLLQTWQEKSASYGHITADQLKDDAVCQGPVVKPDYQCFSRVIIPDPRKVQYGYCLNGEFHMCGYNNPSSCDSTRRPPCVHQPTLAPPTTTTTTFAGEVLELKTSWKIGSTWNFACLTYDTIHPGRNVFGMHCGGAAAQLWGIPAGEDRLQLMLNGLCLTAVDAPANNLTDVLHKNVVLDPCDSGSTAQQFQWQENGIVKLGTDNLCLDWDVAGIYEKDNVYMYTCNGQTNQVWYQILQLGRLQTSWKFNSGRVELRCLTYGYNELNVQGGGCDLAPSVFRSKTQHHAQMFVESRGQFLCLTAYPFENLVSWNDTLKLMRKKEVDLSPCDASNSAQAFEMTKSTQIKLQNDSGLCLDWNVGGKFGRPDDIYLFGCTPNSNQRWTQLN